jgi:hypothetical protein
VRLEGLGQLKNPVTSSEIESATYRLDLSLSGNCVAHYGAIRKLVKPSKITEVVTLVTYIWGNSCTNLGRITKYEVFRLF